MRTTLSRLLPLGAAAGFLLAATTSASASSHMDAPLNTLDDRMAVIAALHCVDLVVPFDDDTPRALIAAALPEIIVKGGDYAAETTAGAAEVIAAGGRFVSIPFRFDRSTTALLKRIRG